MLLLDDDEKPQEKDDNNLKHKTTDNAEKGSKR